MFERFTDQARRVIVLAQERARGLDHDHIGTEHLLLGLLSEGSDPARQVLQAAGITETAASAEVEREVGRGTRRSSSSGHVPFTPGARQVLEGALREAVRLYHHGIGPGHLLLALLAAEDSRALRVVQALGADPQELRARVEPLIVNEAPAGDVLPLAPLARRVIAAAGREAEQQHAHRIEVEHLLLAMIADEQGPAAHLLAGQGVDLPALRQAVLHRLAQAPQHGTDGEIGPDRTRRACGPQPPEDRRG